MDVGKRFEWQVKEKCGNRIVKVILERIRTQFQVLESRRKGNKSNEASSSPKIILENQNGRLLGARNPSTESNDRSSTAKKLTTAKSNPKVACRICNVIVSKKRIGRHFKTKHPENNLQCDLCPYKCTTQRWLEHRILEVHVVDKPFECGICFKSFMTNVMLTKHKRTHADKSLSCNLCPAKSFKDSACLKKHLEAVHRRYNKHCESEAPCNNLLCPACDTWFLADADLAQHLKIPKDKSVMKCELCSETVHTPCRLNQHLLKMHSKPSIEDASMTRNKHEGVVESPAISKQRLHSKETTEISTSVKNEVSTNTFSCIVCSSLFSRRSDLELHELQKKHRRWKCSICAKLFTRREFLKRHIQIIHSDARPFQCTYKGCSKSFKEMRVLKRHMIMHDADQYCIQCSICSKMFSTRQTLKQHLLTHTDERPWPCKFCDIMFKCFREASRHLKKCQDRSEELRKEIGRRSNAALEGAKKHKRKKTISSSHKNSTRQTVKLHKTLTPEPKATSTNTLTCAATSCNENGTKLKLIKQEKMDIKYLGDDLNISEVTRPGGISAISLEMVPKQEMCSDSSN